MLRSTGQPAIEMYDVPMSMNKGKGCKLKQDSSVAATLQPGSNVVKLHACRGATHIGAAQSANKLDLEGAQHGAGIGGVGPLNLALQKHDRVVCSVGHEFSMGCSEHFIVLRSRWNCNSYGTL